MRSLLFISKVAFICNIFFVLCLLMRHTNIHIPASFHEFILITGWILSICINFLLVSSVVIFKIMKKETHLPLWMNVINTFCFLFQIVYYLISL